VEKEEASQNDNVEEVVEE